MKNILFAVLLFISLSSFAQQKEYEGKMQVTPLQLEQKGDSLYIKIRFDMSGVNVDLHRSISLLPVLVAPQRTMTFPEVMVKGRINYRAYMREMALMSEKERAAYSATAPYTVLQGYKSKNARSVEYRKVIAYEPWMAEARMDIQEDLCGCGNPPRTLAMSQLINRVQTEVVIVPYQPRPTLAYVNPEVEVVKHREMVGEAFLDFMVNQIAIRPDYKSNPQELKKITDMIDEAQKDKNISVGSIFVEGYASPEGSIEGNKRLSEGRANALVAYLVPRFDYPRSLYKVEYGGENWIGLKEAVEKMEWQYKDEVLHILETIPAGIDTKRDLGRKKSLMQLEGGEPYRYLLKEVFPSLRKAICKIDYVVKGFEVADAKAIIGKRPQDLSLNEMFMVANTYENGSQEFIDVFELAVRLYPDDPTANLNAASAALARNDIQSAERYLQRINSNVQTPELDNARGVLSMLKGNYGQAESYFNAAANAGLEAAAVNLTELAKKLQNLEAIEKQSSYNLHK